MICIQILEKRHYGFLRFLLDDYEETFKVDNLLSLIDEYENIPYIKKDEIIKLLSNKNYFQYYEDFEIHNNTLIFCSEKSQNLIKDIENKIRNKECNFNKIISFLDRAEIKCIIEKRKDNPKSKKVLFKRKGTYQFLKNKTNMEKFDFKAMNDFISKYNIHDKYNYKNELEKAYINCYLNDYLNAYEIYKNLSKNALRNKDFIIFTISEFNRYYVGRTIINNYFENTENRNIIKNEINKMELDKIPLKFPFNSVELSFVKLILNWKFDNSKMSNIRKKVNIDEQTFFLMANEESIGINQAKEYITNFYNFIRYNYLAINQYDEVKRVFYDYIDLIMKNYATPKIILEQNSSFFGEQLESIKLEQFDIDDIRFMIDYLSKKEIENILNRYEIKYLKIDDKEITLYFELMKNRIEYLSNYHKKYFYNDLDKILLILSTIKLDSTYSNEIINELIQYIRNKGINISDYKYLNKFIYNQYDEYEEENTEQLMNLLLIILEQIGKDNNSYNDQLILISNLTFYIYNISNKAKIENKDVVNRLIENQNYSVLIGICKILKTSELNKVKLIISNKLKEENYGESHCNIYYESSMNKIIEPNKEYEIKFYNYLKKLKKQIVDEENRTVRTYPSAKEHLEHNLILINNLKLNGYIQNSKLFEEFLGIFDNYDFLFDINNFDKSKFKLEWLKEYGDKLLTTISKNKKIKLEIQKQVKNIIIDGKKIDKNILSKIFKYFY